MLFGSDYPVLTPDRWLADFDEAADQGRGPTEDPQGERGPPARADESPRERVHGMRNEGLGSWPARRARKTPHRTALVHRRRAVTYAELHDRITRLAHALRALGVRHGDRVAYLGPNHPASWRRFRRRHASARSSSRSTPAWPGPRSPTMLDDSRQRGAGPRPRVRRLVAGLPVPLPTASRRRWPAPSTKRCSPTPAGGAVRRARRPLDDPCIIMYTSGTTGRPKGAMLTHGNLTWNSVNLLVDADSDRRRGHAGRPPRCSTRPG